MSTTSWYSLCLAGVVEVGELGERLVGSLKVVGFVEFVELLESVPSCAEAGVGREQPLEVGLVGFCETVGSSQQGEARSEQVRLERRGPLIRFSALEFSSHQSQAFGEPSDYVEAVQHMTSVGQILRDSCLI